MVFESSIRGLPAPENGERVPSRMNDPQKSRTLLVSQRARLAPMWDIFDEVQSQLDCIPPDTEQALRADGLAHLTNVNWGSMEAAVAAATEPVYNLMNGGRIFMRFHVSPKSRRDPITTQALESLSLSHKELFQGWGSRQPVMEQLASFRTAFGLGITYHPRPLSWEFESLHPRNLIYPARATTDVNKWAYAGVVTSLDVPYLLERIAKGGKDAGWNYAGIRQAIRLFNQEALQACDSVIRRPDLYFTGHGVNDLAFDMRENQQIPAFLFYVKEWDNRVSEHVILDHSEATFLFSQVGKFKSMSECMNLLPHEIGPGVVAKLRGLAVKQLPMHDALNRIQNHEVDLAFMSGLIMQASDGSTLRKISEVVFGASVIIPPGLQVQQTSFKDTGASARATGASMRSILAQQGAAFGGEVDVGEYEKTNAQFDKIYTDKTQMRTFQVERLSGQMDTFCIAHFNRLVEASESGEAQSKQMFQDAIDDGLTPEIMKQVRRVSHQTGSARGMKVNAMQGMEASKQYWGLFSEQGKQQFAAEHMAILLDDEDLSGRVLQSTPTTYDTEEEQKALMENGIMHTGNPVMIAGNDSHYLHLKTHTAWMEALIAACQQGQEDPKRCYQAIQIAMTHCAPRMVPQPPGAQPLPPGHLDLLSQDAAQEQAVKAFASQWSQVLNFWKQLQQQLQAQAQKQQEQAQAAAQTPQIDPVKQAQIMTIQADLRMKEATHAQTMRHTDEKHSQTLRDMKELTQAKAHAIDTSIPSPDPAPTDAALGITGPPPGVPGGLPFTIPASPGAIPAGAPAS